MSTTEPTRRSFLDRFRRPTPPALEHSTPPAPPEPSTSSGQERTLTQRMEAEYLAGYDARIRTGLTYATADADTRVTLRDQTLQAKVATYQELDELTATLDRELPGMAKYFDTEAGNQPLTPTVEAALERAAHLAGRWDGIDPVISSQLANIEHSTSDVAHTSSVTFAGDSRDAWFNYLEPDTQTARKGLIQIDRDTTERLTQAAAQSKVPSETIAASASVTATTQSPRASSVARVPGKPFQPASPSPASRPAPTRGSADLTL